MEDGNYIWLETDILFDTNIWVGFMVAVWDSVDLMTLIIPNAISLVASIYNQADYLWQTQALL